ncbi:IMP cyclohydrolase [Candidatus Allofournierella merdavium]|uniref:IMP cyclohydrolase n=1 Tax=Candidatus Allofournierella merdavium TaxID=2838593 RepID=UPI00374FD53A
MELLDLYEQLKTNAYPGRGIVLGLAPSGKKALIAYFIMGRSANSRNRVFDPVPQIGGIRTLATDPEKLQDPSLIIYNPVRTVGEDTHIVTNGDQTDTVYEFMSRGESFEAALRTRTFEPDGPNWTPRISGVVELADGACSYKLSILKSADGNGESCRRYFFEYPQPVAGEGHFLHTYKCDGSPIPSFEGEPERVALPEDAEELAVKMWEALNEDNKVSLFVRGIDLATGETEDVIINKYDAVCEE